MSIRTTDVTWLEGLAEQAQAKVEVDMEGNIIVSPATDPHLFAVARLLGPLSGACPKGLVVVAEGPWWTPLSSDEPSYVPDLGVLDEAMFSSRRSDLRLEVPPLLVVEILSPTSRRRDLGEKVEGYYAGGAEAYWTVEVPDLTGVATVELTIRTRGADAWDTSGPLTGVVDIEFPFPVQVDLSTLAAPK